MSSLDRILPFLRPIEDLLRDPDRHRGHGELRRPARVRRARAGRWKWSRIAPWRSGT